MLMSYAWAVDLPADDKLVLLALCDMAEDDGELPRLGARDLVKVLEQRFRGSAFKLANGFDCLRARDLVDFHETRLVWRLNVANLIRAVRRVD